jgi:hypothetical protein
MAKTKEPKIETKVCDVTGIKAPITAFYSKQSHLKAVDKLRRASNATKPQIAKFYQELQILN